MRLFVFAFVSRRNDVVNVRARTIRIKVYMKASDRRYTSARVPQKQGVHHRRPTRARHGIETRHAVCIQIVFIQRIFINARKQIVRVLISLRLSYSVCLPTVRT